MKKILLSIILIISCYVVLSQTPCPSQFKRNNGNAGGCSARVTLSFDVCISSAPTIDSIYISGAKFPEIFSLIKLKCSGSSSTAEYCASGSNLPPVNDITFYFTYSSGGSGSGSSTKSVCSVSSTLVLPVTLNGFNAQRNNDNTVGINWQTEQEINSASFEIERSYDNTTFEKIGTIAAAGNSSVLKSYTFSDNSNNSKNASIYRIKMIDKDGAFTYSEIKSVKGSNSASDFLMYPNPGYSNSKVTISQLNGTSVVKLFDLSGRTVKTISVENANSTEINNLQKGIYFVQVIDKNSGNTQVKKLSVIN